MAAKFRVGVIGTGYIVENAHLPAICCRRDVKVEWIADVNQARSNQVAQLYGLRTIDPKEIDSRLGEVDICLIATPLGVRQPYIDACREANVAIYVEKPFARTREEHDRYCRGFPPHKVAIGYQRRTYRSLNLLKYAVRQQLFGKPISVACDIGGYCLKSGGSTFVSQAEMAGGGVLIELGTHVLDQLVQLIDPDQIQIGSASTLVESRQDFHLEMNCQLGTEDGVVETRGRFSRLLPSSNEFNVECEHAWLRTGTDADSPVWIRAKDDDQLFVLQLGEPLPSCHNATTTQHAFSTLWNEFLTGLEEDRPNLSSAVTARLTTQWLEEIYARAFDD